jgi:hypothetical protein
VKTFCVTVLTLSAVILTISLPLHGQAVANAQMHGMVADASGAVVKDAQIKATQTDTGQVRTTTSDAEGSYLLPNLPVGPYDLQVTSPAFKTFIQTGIILQVGSNVQVNVSLQLGAVTQEVRISANAAMVETRTPPFPR